VRSLVLAVPLLLVAPGVAGAAVVPGDYGGGAVKGRGGPGHLRNGTVWMWARVAADGRARIGGAAHVACGLTRFDAEVTLAPDGSFRFSRIRTSRQAGHRLRTVVTVQGRFDGAAASGTVRGRLRNRQPDGEVRRCSTGGARDWQLRMPPAPGPPAPAQAGATYHGLTSQQGDVPRPFLLAVARSGARVKATIFEYKVGCAKLSYESNDVSRGARIRAGGTFLVRESFAFRSPRLVERVRVRVAGGFSAGQASGTVRVHSVVRSRRSGRVVDRCDTGHLTFNAQT
jgi:hypothetical protein